MRRLLLFATLTGMMESAIIRADTLTSGSATINFYQSAWNALASAYGSPPVLTLSAFINQAQANALTAAQVLTNIPGAPSYTNQVYAMNGATVTNLAGRTAQPTTFFFTPSQLTQHTGTIGLGGIARFDVLGGLGGSLLYGDYTLQYDSSRIALGGSGWYLKGNIPPAGAVFDLVNATVVETNNTLTITGSLAVTYEVAHFLYNTPSDWLAVVGDFSFTGQAVATVLNGRAVINCSQSAWESLASGFATPPVLTLSAFFNQAQANALNQDQLLTNVQASYSYTNEIYMMNGGTVTNLPTRYTQPTTFQYQRGSLTNQTGSIGLGGVARFAVLGGAYGNLLFGDYTLQYDSSRIALGGSGWYLGDNIPPAAPAFDLLNVNVTETTNYFSIAGDLGVSFELANLLFDTPSDTLAGVGTFTFTGYTVPFTTPVISRLSLGGGKATLLGANGLAGSGYTVISTTNLALPSTAWDIHGTGTFADDGKTTNAIPVTASEAGQFFRLQQP